MQTKMNAIATFTNLIMKHECCRKNGSN